MDLKNLKQLLTEDDAVSPVIGVILMVAITVILAAVIASFVLGLGDQAQQTTPQASFAWDYDASGGNNVVTITHDGGDSIQANELYVRGTADSGGPSVDTKFSNITTGGTSIGSEMTAGQRVVINGSNSDGAGNDIGSGYDLRVIYETQEGDNSATLAQDTGPDA
jgi:flagellin-like protein